MQNRYSGLAMYTTNRDKVMHKSSQLLPDFQNLADLTAALPASAIGGGFAFSERTLHKPQALRLRRPHSCSA
jgi:hypothetical protein